MVVLSVRCFESRTRSTAGRVAGWGGGKPEISHNLDDPFRGLALGIKFQGTTAEAISRRWVWQSFLILGVLSS
jgi:hypothetical protein